MYIILVCGISWSAGSLTPTFVTARPVSLAVRLAYAFTLSGMVSVHAERTFERLRYLFGGDRPSQTARLTMSPDSIQSHRLEFQHLKSGIPTMTPYKLTPVFPSLPPILYMKYRNPILQGWYPNIDSSATGVTDSQSPTYPVHAVPNPSIKLE